MTKILIKNIKGLVQAGENLPLVLKGKQMSSLPILENAFLALEDGEVIDYGLMFNAKNKKLLKLIVVVIIVIVIIKLKIV